MHLCWHFKYAVDSDSNWPLGWTMPKNPTSTRGNNRELHLIASRPPQDNMKFSIWTFSAQKKPEEGQALKLFDRASDPNFSLCPEMSRSGILSDSEMAPNVGKIARWRPLTYTELKYRKYATNIWKIQQISTCFKTLTHYSYLYAMKNHYFEMPEDFLDL